MTNQSPNAQFHAPSIRHAKNTSDRRMVARLPRLGLSAVLAAALTTNAARAEMLPVLESALQTCLSRDLSAEARFTQLEADGWQFVRDTPEARENSALTTIFIVMGWGYYPNWRAKADLHKSRFAKLINEPHPQVAHQTAEYGDTFTASVVMSSKRDVVFVYLEHPDVSGELGISFVARSESGTQFRCALNLVELPAPDDVFAMMPENAVRGDVPDRPGVFRARFTTDGEGPFNLFYQPLTSMADSAEMLSILDVKYGFGGWLSTFVTPVEVSAP